MAKITLEKTHDLLEKLAEHVMQNVPTKEEVPSKQEFMVLSNKVDNLDLKVNDLDHKVGNLEQKVDSLVTGMDGQAKQMEALRIEQAALHHGLNRIEKKIDTHEKVYH